MIKNLKRIISLILIVIMILSVVPAVSASASATVYADSLAVKAGETISVSVNISQNPGFMGFALILEFDEEVFTPVSVSPGALIKNGVLNDSIGAMQSNMVKVVYSDTGNVFGDGALFTVTFAVSEEAMGSSNISLSCLQDDTFNEDYEDVVFECRDIAVVVNNPVLRSYTRFYAQPLRSQSDSTVTVPLIVENGTGMNSFVLKAEFDRSVFTFVKVEAGGILNGSKPQTVIDASQNIYFKWKGAGLERDGILMYITFKIADYVNSKEKIKMLCESISFADGSNNQSACADILIDINNKYASEAPTVYSVDSVHLSGDTIEIPVFIRNNHGIMGFGFNIAYDSSILTPIEIKKGDIIANGMSDNNIGLKNNSIKVIWSSSENMFDDGLLFTMVFAVTEGAKPAALPLSLSYSAADTFNEQWNDVELNMNISDIPTTYMTLTAPKNQLKKGEIIKLNAVYKRGGVDGGIVWSSTDPLVASVSQSGILTAVGSGSTTVVAETADGKFSRSVVINVAYDSPVIKIYNYGGSNEKKLDWWKPYSSATMNLGYIAYNCNSAVCYKWSSSNSKVKVDERGFVTNTGRFARSSIITLTAYDADGNVIASNNLKVSFYKFDWQFNALKTQSVVSDDYSDYVCCGAFERIAAILENILSLINGFFGNSLKLFR